MKIVWSKGFTLSYRKVIKKNPQLKTKIFDVLRLLANDPFNPSLKSHKLSGKLEGLWSCSVAYDCRIVFAFSEEGDFPEIIILLIEIGSHDDVYGRKKL